MNFTRIRYRFVFSLVGVLLAFWGCKEEPEPQPPFDYADGVFFVNEGNFQGGNASLSFLRRSDDSLRDDIFEWENERPLGDVAQSITVIGNRAYIVVNNSGKVEVVDLPSLRSHCSILGLNSPRYLLPLGNGKALVSDLYSRTISVLDLTNCAVVGSIATGGWTEEMVLVDNRVFVTQTGTDKLLVIDVGTQTLTDSIFVGREPNSLVVDQNGKLWVLCGSALGLATPQLVRFDLDSLSIEATFPFASNTLSPSKLRINNAGDRMYFLNGGIFQMGITDSNLPSQAWIPQSTHTWYGLAVDPVTDHIYAGDALDFQRRGKVYRFVAGSSTVLATFDAGIIPGEFAFLP
jgi:YVTN family beta-propeller protein